MMRRSVITLCAFLLVSTMGRGGVLAEDGLRLSDEYSLTPGLDQTLLLLEGDRLLRLSGDGQNVLETISLSQSFRFVGERADAFVLVSNDPREIQVIDKATGEILSQLKLPYREVMDLALHPKLPVSYIAVRVDVQAPRFRVLLFDEEEGTAEEPRDLFGTFVNVHPAGTMLITGHRDMYQRGTRFFMNPDFRVHATPEYGSIDLLIAYALDDEGQPSFLDYKTSAGGNGKGLRMSPDGRRVTYLSHVGYPKYSGNLGGWNPLELQQLPVTYETKDVGSTTDLAYHPMLPICASPGSGAAVLFHRETGERVEILPDSAAPLDEVHRVYFSPDGEHLLLDSSHEGIRALRSLALSLTEAERERLAEGVDVEDNRVQVAAAMYRTGAASEERSPSGHVAVDKAIDWIRLHNKFGPDHPIVEDQSKAIQEAVDGNRNLILTFGRDLVKSECQSYIAFWNGQGFVYELDEATTARSELAGNQLIASRGSEAGWRLTHPKVKLESVEFEPIVDGQQVQGRVNYRRLEPEEGYYALKLEYVLDGSTVTLYHHLGEYLTKDEGSWEFTFSALGKGDKRPKRVVPMFVEFVEFATRRRQGDTAIASNTLMEVVVVEED